MREHSKSVPPSATTAREQEEKVSTITREYILLTPLFGGGVEPAEYDPVTIVRATEIRGHLRFWWRACRGGDYKTLEELKAAEDAIWGKAHKKGDKNPLKYCEIVQIVVEVSDDNVKKIEEIRPFPISDQEKDRRGNPKYTARYDKFTDIPEYAAFPLQPTKQELEKNRPPNGPIPDSRPVYHNIHFTLVIRFPEKHFEDIKAALWAWQTFGGLGARTRRGFGALSVIKRPENIASKDASEKKDPKVEVHFPENSSTSVVTAWLCARLEDEKYVSSGSAPEGVPHLSKTIRFHIVSTHVNTKVVWKDLIAKLERFRQYPYGRSGRGGSYWPEANAIRHILGSPSKQRKNETHPPLLRFPRAACGLPIVFHFLNEEDIDELAPTLQGGQEGSERLASPIILRPLLCGDNKTVGLALLLDNYRLPPEMIVIKEKGIQRRDGSIVEGKKHEVVVPLTEEDLKQLPNLKLSSKTDILQAFMDYLEGKL